MMHRDRLGMLVDMLRVSYNGRKKYALQSFANLSWPLSGQLLEKALKHGLISYNIQSRIYSITGAGQQFIYQYEKLISVIEELK